MIGAGMFVIIFVQVTSDQLLNSSPNFRLYALIWNGKFDIRSEVIYGLIPCTFKLFMSVLEGQLEISEIICTYLQTSQGKYEKKVSE